MKDRKDAHWSVVWESTGGRSIRKGIFVSVEAQTKSDSVTVSSGYCVVRPTALRCWRPPPPPFHVAAAALRSIVKQISHVLSRAAIAKIYKIAVLAFIFQQTSPNCMQQHKAAPWRRGSVLGS